MPKALERTLNPADKAQSPDYWIGYNDGYNKALISIARLAREHRNGSTGDIDIGLLVLLEAVEAALKDRT